MEHGQLCAVLVGISLMLQWFVVSWAISMQHLLPLMLPMEQAVAQYGTLMWHVLVLSHPYSTALVWIVGSTDILARTVMMPVLFATEVSSAFILASSWYSCMYITAHTVLIMPIDGKLRLSNSGSVTATRGHVEVSIDGEWGTVCDNAWNLDDATVVCQQLGYSGAWTAYYQPGEGLVKVEEPQCTGEETTLLDCWTAQTNGGNAFCSHGRDVAVDCMTTSVYYGTTVHKAIHLSTTRK